MLEIKTIKFIERENIGDPTYLEICTKFYSEVLDTILNSNPK
jgi:hypothetical protein